MPRPLSIALVMSLCLSQPALAGNVPLSVPESYPVESLYLQPGGPHARYDVMLEVDARDIARRDHHLFIAAGNDGLVIMQTQGREAPRELVRLRLPGPASRVRLHGDIAWLTGPTGLTSVDISQPAFPDVVMHYPLPVEPRDIALGDERAWLLLNREILTFDLSFPGAPIMISRSGLRFDAHALAVRHNRAWLAAGDGGLITFDIRRPPPHAAGMIAGGPVTDVAISGDRILAAGGEGGLTLVEGAGIDGMRWLGSFRAAVGLPRLTADGGRALAQTADGQLVLLDIANPEAIRLVSRLSPACCDAWHLEGDTALVLNGRRLTAFDLSPAGPQLGNEGLAAGQGVNFGGQRRVFIDGDVAHVADWFAGLHLYDIAEPARPRLLSSLNMEGSAKGVVVRDGIAYVADDDHGLQVVDVRDPRRPVRLARLALPGLAYTPVLDGDHLWLSVHDAGIVAIDISDPAAPLLRAQYDTPGKAWSLRVRDGIAFVADDDQGLLVLDVSDPAAIRPLGGYNPGGRAEEVMIDGDVAYVAFFDAGLYILDISQPAEPRRLANLTTPGNPRGLDLHDGHLHVADWRAGLQVIDVRDPQRPRLRGRHDTDGAAWGVQVFGDHAFVADWWGGVVIVALADPDRPTAVAAWPPRAPVQAIATADRFAYLAQSTAGVQVFDIDNPLNPTWVTAVELDEARDIALIGERAYALDRDAIVAIDITNPFSARRVATLPLPHATDALHAAGDRLLLAGADAVSLLDPVDGEVQHIAAGRAIHAAAWADGQVVITGARGLQAFDAQGSAVAERYTDTGEPMPTVVAASARQVAVAFADGGDLRILSTDDWLERARIPLVGAVQALHFDGDRLHVVTDHPGVLTLDLASPTDWRVVSWQDTLGAVSAVTAHRDTLYLAGSRQLLAREAPLAARFRRTGPDSVVIEAPAGLGAGAWDLATTQPAPPGPVLRHGAVTVEAPAFGGRQMTAEEFDALMQQHLRTQE